MLLRDTFSFTVHKWDLTFLCFLHSQNEAFLISMADLSLISGISGNL